MEQTELNKEKTKKIKLDFKDSKYSTGEEKSPLQKYGLKRALEKYLLMVKLWVTILKDLFIS